MVAGLRRSLRHTHTLGTLRTRTSHALFTMFSSRALLLLQGSGSFRAGRTMRKTAMGSVCCHHHRRRAFCSHNNSSSNNGEDLREFIATLGVYFTLPEQGVTSPEILTRCSATPVRLTPESPLRFLAAGHAVLPWAFPGYFGESKAWLKFLNQTNVRYYAELREPSSGTVLAKHELVNLAHHPTRDVAALGLKNEDEALADIRSRGLPFSPLRLRQRLLDEDDALQVVGYEVRERPDMERGDDPDMVMVRARGELAARTAKQAFVRTDHATLNPGMCGGAVLDANLALCGCVEGVVPTTVGEGVEVAEHVRALQGMPCVVEWRDLDAVLSATMADVDDDFESAKAAQQEQLSAQEEVR